MYDEFLLSKYVISISAGEKGLDLPFFKGSTFRGAVGKVLRKIVCSYGPKEDCQECLLKERCVYAYLFDTSPPIDTRALRNYQNIPRPFVIQPPLESKEHYKPGEIINLKLVLIGKAIDYFPYFVLVFREMGNEGLGKQRKSFQLKDIYSKTPEGEKLIYDHKQNLIKSENLTYSWEDLIENEYSPFMQEEKIVTEENRDYSIQNHSNDSKIQSEDVNKVKIHFNSPVRLQDKGKLVQIPEFHILFRHLLRRVSSLYYFHQGSYLDIDYSNLVEKSYEVKLVENNTLWQDWERYSNHQRRKIPMGGLVGSIMYEGNLDDFLPWLRLGEEIHVGKNTVFGMGAYSLVLM